MPKKPLRKYVKANHYICDPNYFEVQTTQNCYWAGFIAATGRIEQNKQTYKTLVCSVNKEDSAHLELFKQTVSPTVPLTESLEKVYLRVYCSKLCQDLAGITPSTIKNMDRIKAYIIGLIDGGGNVFVDALTNRPQIYIAPGSRDTLNWVVRFLRFPHKIYELPRATKYLLLTYTGPDAVQLTEFLSDVDVPRLDRKWFKLT